MSRKKIQMSKQYYNELFLHLFKYEWKKLKKYTCVNTILDK